MNLSKGSPLVELGKPADCDREAGEIISEAGEVSLTESSDRRDRRTRLLIQAPIFNIVLHDV